MFDNLEPKKNNNVNNHSINLLPDKMRSKSEKSYKHRKPVYNNGDFHFPEDSKNRKILAKKQKANDKEKPSKPDQADKFSFKNILLKLGLGASKAKSGSKSVQPDLQAARPIKSDNSSNHNKKEHQASSRLASPLANLKPSRPQPIKNKSDHHQKPEQPGQKQDKIKVDEPTKQPKKITADNKFSVVKEDEKEIPEDEEVEVNLLPYEKKYFSSKQALLFHLAVLLFCILATVSAFIFYKNKEQYYYRQEQELDINIASITSDINQGREQIEKLGPLAYRLRYTDDLIASHVYFSNFFPYLESSTVSKVYFSSISIGSDYSVSVQARAADLRSVAEQLIVFKQSDILSQVSLQNLNLNSRDERVAGGQVIEFSLSFKVDPEIFNNN